MALTLIKFSHRVSRYCFAEIHAFHEQNVILLIEGGWQDGTGHGLSHLLSAGKPNIRSFQVCWGTALSNKCPHVDIVDIAYVNDSLDSAFCLRNAFEETVNSTVEEHVIKIVKNKCWVHPVAKARHPTMIF